MVIRWADTCTDLMSVSAAASKALNPSADLAASPMCVCVNACACDDDVSVRVRASPPAQGRCSHRGCDEQSRAGAQCVRVPLSSAFRWLRAYAASAT